MKNTLRIAILLALAARLPATTLITLPTTGLLIGSPGETVGWGFSTTDDSFTLSLSYSQSLLVNETNPLMGTYTDLIGPSGGPDNFFVDAGQTWSQSFDLTNQVGLGFYTIDPNAVIGSTDSGVIRVFYNYSDSTPGSIDVPFLVEVVDEVVAPEPSSWQLIAIGAMLIVAMRHRL
jgi:hypothetical protein